MFVYPMFVDRHQCSPIPLGEKKIKHKIIGPCPDRAGYVCDAFEYDLSECPVCKSKYTYNEKKTGTKIFISTRELIK